LFIGRKPKEDYYTAYTKIIDNPLPKYLIRISFAFLLLIGVIGYLATVIAYA
jgi:preprotein translocase subunit Sss1